ncbi:MAG: hypothetical protein E7B59_09075 [Enterobacteriaceae bacterium]|nr:hypothetical protein [Enterobacteriaceae bacterium]
MNTFNRISSIVWLMLCVMVLTGCEDNDVNNAINVVEVFHKQFNKNDFNYIYLNVVSDDFKKSMTKSDYFSLMHKNSSILGKYQYGRLLKSEQVQVIIGSNKVNLTYHSTYANYELNELFVVKIDGGQQKIDQIVYDDINVIKLKK